MNWGVDVDGVIADFSSAYHAMACHVLRRLLPPLVHSDWDLGKSLGLSGAELDLVESAMKKEGIASALSPIEGAVEAVGKLSEIVRVVFVTSPYRGAPTWPHEREEWLVKHFGERQGRRVIHTRYKNMVAVDTLLDDRAATILKWLQDRRRNGARFGVCWSAPHNENVHALLPKPSVPPDLGWGVPPLPSEEDPPIVFRTNSWEDVHQLAWGKTIR
jgi:5'(3')-deoxyribonucleotidase